MPSAETVAQATDASSATSASASTDERGRQERLVDIGDRQLHMICSGDGAPVVILDHGLDGKSGDWLIVLDRAAETANTRVCAYDRAGRGKSDPAQGTRTGQDLADDLHRLIDAADIEPPVVLVGHSIAGLHLRLLATQHPEDVAAMVLVDPSHPDENQRLAQALPPPSPDEPPLVRQLREVAEAGDPVGASNREQLEVGTTNEQVRATGTLGALPLAVLTAGAVIEHDADGRLSPTLVAKGQELHETLLGELAALSSNSTHVVVPGAGHFIQEEQPQAVADAVAAAVETARDGGRIADRLPPT
jgi:pimeloyl-ACP methyl ester carboxylesterase